MISPLLAAVIIGSFWTGVGVTAAANNGGFFDRSSRDDVVITAEPVLDGHVAACSARYRSYDEETDMYLGYDGDWHLCRL